MKGRSRGKALALPMLMTNMALASWETIARRTMMMAQNRCSTAEYGRMVSEKAAAAMESGMRMAWSGGGASLATLMAPWSRRATANAKRLRKK
jgi:hypothetical protein